MRATVIALGLTIVLSIALTVIGFASAAPGAVIPSFLCGVPLAGFLMGRLSMMIDIVPKERGQRRTTRQTSGTVLN